MNNSYLGNAFSLQMISMDLWREGYSPRVSLVTEMPDLRSLISCVGHPDTASVLGVECNRVSISLEPGDVLYVAQLQGGRLPEGSTTLPEGFHFEFFLVELVKD